MMLTLPVEIELAGRLVLAGDVLAENRVVFGPSISPGSGDGAAAGLRRRQADGPGAHVRRRDGAARRRRRSARVMITGAGEPLGAGDALGTGGGVTAAGDADGGGGTRICGPCGATGGPTYGGGRRRRRRRGGGRRRRRFATCAASATAAVPQPCSSSASARARRRLRCAHAGTGTEQTANESATAIALARRSGPHHRSSRQTSQPPAAVTMTFGSHAATYGSSAPFLPNAPASATIP